MLSSTRTLRRTYRRARQNRSIRTRFGLTLIELLLVLVIMVIAAALVVPRLSEAEGRRSLLTAADQLNGSLVSTRQQSLAAGQTMFLIYQAGTPLYAVVPEPIDDETRNQFDQVTTMLSQVAGSYDPATDQGGLLEGTTGIRKLPVGTQFLSGVSGIAQANDMSGMQAEILGMPYVAFAPDGTTDDAVLELVNEETDQIAIQLRGLTGTARVGELIPAGSIVGGTVQP